MITSEMVKHIQGTLNSLTKGKNTNFGVNTPATEIPAEGILVVLTKNKNLESFTSYDEILASSTVLGKNDVDIFTVEGKTINVINIPYSETISINKGTATGFAIVKVESSNLIQADITGSDVAVTPYRKYIINATSDAADVINYKILFSGELSTEQPIEVNNSFSLSNIKITFNS